ncbi:rhodanese-like domain-containing protein [Nonomuraea salmonea]|uniref:rhodanese-like domain-containing protein n=1 Tax=Nonomuraea salmonea TaxID=46181 RepID=UPI002FE7E6E5
MVGLLLAVPGTGAMLNCLRWTFPGGAPIDPETWQPAATVYERAAAAGVEPVYVAPAEFEGTGLTRAVYRGVRYVPAATVDDRVARVHEALRARRRSHVTVYYGDLDAAGHLQGWGGEEWLRQLEIVDDMARRLAEGLPPGSALYVTADHGMINATEKIDAESVPELTEGVAMLGGESRARHVYAQPGGRRAGARRLAGDAGRAGLGGVAAGGRRVRLVRPPRTRAVAGPHRRCRGRPPHRPRHHRSQQTSRRGGVHRLPRLADLGGAARPAPGGTPVTSPLITPAALADLVRQGEVTVLDVRWRLGGPPGLESYREGHIEGAVYCDLDTDLAAPPGAGGRHPLPGAAAFQSAMRRLGVSAGRPVVVYDDAAATVAARAWWTLRYFGHQDVRVLDGGLPAWLAAGFPVTKEAPAPAEGDFTARPGGMPVLSADEAGELAGRGVLLDARAGERYRGEVEPVDPVAGHVPGAVSAPTTGNVTPDGRFLAPPMTCAPASPPWAWATASRRARTAARA